MENGKTQKAIQIETQSASNCKFFSEPALIRQGMCMLKHSPMILISDLNRTRQQFMHLYCRFDRHRQNGKKRETNEVISKKRVRGRNGIHFKVLFYQFEFMFSRPFYQL